MSLPVSSQADLYNLFVQTLQDQRPDLTDTNIGSIIDSLGGAFSLAGTELVRLVIDRFNKCFFDLANGPEVTGGPDDLQTLAVDHFGSAFARPGVIAAVDVATFSRANNSNGAVTIPAGTIIKTKPDANGNAQRYITNSDVTLTNSSAPSDLTITVGITAITAGVAGNASIHTITVIESGLTDSSIVVTNAGNATGSDAQSDSVYRQTIANLIIALSGATIAAIQAKALTVSGVKVATPVETAMNVIQYNVGTGLTVGTYFRIPFPALYIADATGTANAALLAAVRAAIENVRACGAFINVLPASAVSINWTGSITLNPAGPNYGTFSSDTTQIVSSMKDYINALPIGTNFVRATANAAILALWGAAGTNDLTAFTTSVPSGDVTAALTQKFVAGTVAIS